MCYQPSDVEYSGGSSLCSQIPTQINPASGYVYPGNIVLTHASFDSVAHEPKAGFSFRVLITGSIGHFMRVSPAVFADCVKSDREGAILFARTLYSMQSEEEFPDYDRPFQPFEPRHRRHLRVLSSRVIHLLDYLTSDGQTIEIWVKDLERYMDNIRREQMFLLPRSGTHGEWLYI